MKAKEHTLDVDHFRGIGLTYSNIPGKENIELIKDRGNNHRINDIYNPYGNKIWVSNLKGIQENKYNHSIPLNKIGLLSENFKRMKKNENTIN